MARKKKHEEHANHERWLVSYADFITLLFAFFVVMFAASSADHKKAGQVAQSVQQGFSELAIFPPSSSIFSLFRETGMPSDTVSLVGVSSEFPNTGSGEVETIEEVRRSLDALLESQIREGAIRLNVDERGLTISLAEAGFFATGSAQIQPDALPILEDIAGRILELPYEVRVEGHTDDTPIHTPRFPSNWELSTSRATGVLQYLISEGEVPPSRLSAVGYGEYRPVATNRTARGRRLNRRVDIVVLNTAMDRFEPKSLAERSLEETGMPSVFSESAEKSDGVESVPGTDGDS